MAKPWYTSKTIWFNALLLLTAIAALFGFADFTPSTQWTEIIGVIVSVVNVILRLTTNKPIENPLARG